MITVRKAGATPNLLKYNVAADGEGGEITIGQETLVKDTVNGPLRNFIMRAVGLVDDEDACQKLLCNPSTRPIVIPRTLKRLAIDAVVEGLARSIGLRIMAEPDAAGIILLEFRHSLTA